jgi:uncharacterized protein DUF6152
VKPSHIVLFGILALVLVVDRAGAHHSFAPVYDAKRTITVQGVVTEFRLINPHALMLMNVTDNTGKVVTWTVEFAGRLNLTEGGWTDRSVTPGETVTVFGNPTHTNSPRVFFLHLVRADGSELYPPSKARDDAIEEQRRQRARERGQLKR